MHEHRFLSWSAVSTTAGLRSSSIATHARSSARRRRLRQACATSIAASMLPYLTGCYTYKRVDASPLPQGSEVSLTITDQGRVGLGDRLGTGVLRVNGRVVNPPDSTWVVRVSSVDMLAGGKSHWSGEEVRLPRSYVSEVATRELSQKKTWLAVGIAVGAVVVAIGAATLIGNGYEGSDPEPPPVGQSSRSPVPISSAAPRP